MAIMESDLGQELDTTIEREDALSKLDRIASVAQKEIESIRLSKKGEQQTHAVTDLASWLEEKSGENEESLQRVVHALNEAKFLMEDEKDVNINDKINDVVEMLRNFSSSGEIGPNDFRTGFHTLTEQLEEFCVALKNETESTQ